MDLGGWSDMTRSAIKPLEQQTRPERVFTDRQLRPFWELNRPPAFLATGANMKLVRQPAQGCELLAHRALGRHLVLLHLSPLIALIVS